MKIKRFFIATHILILSCFLFSCKTNNEVQADQKKIEEIRQGMQVFSSKSTEYRSYPSEVSFFDPSKDASNPQIAIQRRKTFIKNSGLPDETNIVEFKKNNSFGNVFFLYKKYLKDNAGSLYLETFRQYGAWLILTRLDLFASSSVDDLAIIYELLTELAYSNYQGLQLLSYGVEHLYRNDFSKAKIKSLCTSILLYANMDNLTSKIQQPADNPGVSQKPLPPEILESVKNYQENREKNMKVAIQEIKTALEKL
jgi:hypothetical protein